MANKVAYSFVGLDKFSRVADRVKRKTSQVVGSIKRMDKASQKARKNFKRMGDGLSSVGRKMSVVSAIIAAGAVNAVSQAAKFETLGIQFDVLAGSAEKGQRVFKDIKDFAATTPFKLPEIAKAGTMLLGFEVKAEKVVDRLRMLGDLSAGSSASISELAQIFGKIKAGGKLTGETDLQLAERGIVLQTVLAKKYNLSKDAFIKLRAEGKITFNVVKLALQELTSEGGRYAGLTKQLSQSTEGLWSTVIDNLAQVNAEFGELLIAELGIKDGMDSIIKNLGTIVKDFDSWVAAHPGLKKLGLGIAALLITLGPLLLIASSVAVAIVGLGAVAASTSVAVASALVLVPIAIAGWAAIIATNWDAIKETVNSVINSMWLNIEALSMKIQILFNKLKSAASTISNFASGAFSGVMEFIGGESTTVSKSQTEILMEVRAPKDTIGNIKSKTTGQTSGLTVGVNYQEAT